MIFRRKKQNRRGFTVAETVIALALIATVSVSSVSLVLSAQNASMAAHQRQQAQFYAMDILSCYRASTDADFKQNLKFVLGLNPDEDFALHNIPLSGDMAAYVEIESTPIKITIKKASTDGNGKVLAKIEYPLETQGGTP